MLRARRPQRVATRCCRLQAALADLRGAETAVKGLRWELAAAKQAQAEAVAAAQADAAGVKQQLHQQGDDHDTQVRCMLLEWMSMTGRQPASQPVAGVLGAGARGGGATCMSNLRVMPHGAAQVSALLAELADLRRQQEEERAEWQRRLDKLSQQQEAQAAAAKRRLSQAQGALAGGGGGGPNDPAHPGHTRSCTTGQQPGRYQLWGACLSPSNMWLWLQARWTTCKPPQRSRRPHPAPPSAPWSRRWRHCRRSGSRWQMHCLAS